MNSSRGWVTPHTILKGWFNLSPMLNTHRLHLSRCDTSPLLCLQLLLIMLLVFHGTLVWKQSSLLPRNVSFCWEQLHIHSTCTANQQQLVFGSWITTCLTPPGKKQKKGAFLGRFCIWSQTYSSTLLMFLARWALLTQSSCKAVKIRPRPAQVCQLFPVKQSFKTNFKAAVGEKKVLSGSF